jgi:hypothetical protein
MREFTVQPTRLAEQPVKVLSLPETPSTGDLLSSQQFSGSFFINDDFVRWRNPGKLCVDTAVSLGSGIRASGALAPGDGPAAVATQSAV